MNEKKLRSLIDGVKAHKISRRRFIQIMAGVGLSAPMATQLLTWSGVAHAQARSDYKPTKRGGGGALKLLWWQGATLLNPHFAVGTKDQEGSRIFYEPLAGWDAGGQPRAHPRRRNPERAERRPGRGRQVGHLEAEEERAVARRQAVHRRRRDVQLGVQRRSGDGLGVDRQLPGHQGARKSTAIPCASSSRSRPRTGRMRSSARAG